MDKEALACGLFMLLHVGRLIESLSYFDACIVNEYMHSGRLTPGNLETPQGVLSKNPLQIEGYVRLQNLTLKLGKLHDRRILDLS